MAKVSNGLTCMLSVLRPLPAFARDYHTVVVGKSIQQWEHPTTKILSW